MVPRTKKNLATLVYVPILQCTAQQQISFKSVTFDLMRAILSMLFS
jgi:hypothetical protein